MLFCLKKRNIDWWEFWREVIQIEITLHFNYLNNLDHWSSDISWPQKTLLKLDLSRDFLGGPVVKSPPSSAGDAGSIPGWGTKIPHSAGQLSLCAATREPVCHNYRAHTPQLERSPPATMKTRPSQNKNKNKKKTTRPFSEDQHIKSMKIKQSCLKWGSPLRVFEGVLWDPPPARAL